MPDVAWIRYLSSDRELGARLAVRTRVLGVPLVTDEIRVTAWEPPRLLAVRHAGFVEGSGEWRLEDVTAGTRFVWTEDLRMPPPALGELALLVYSPWQKRMLRRSTQNLRRLAEG